MLDTIALIIVALSFGGIMEAAGMLERLSASVLNLARSTGSLITVTVFSCFGMNILASDQYLAIIVPGRTGGSPGARMRASGATSPIVAVPKDASSASASSVPASLTRRAFRS